MLIRACSFLDVKAGSFSRDHPIDYSRSEGGGTASRERERELGGVGWGGEEMEEEGWLVMVVVVCLQKITTISRE